MLTNLSLQFGLQFMQFVANQWNGYCKCKKKQYLCARVVQRVLLKLSQLIGY